MILILDALLAGSRYSLFEYWLKHQWFQSFLEYTIGLSVTLLYTATIWISRKSSVIPIIPWFQYWVPCEPAQGTRYLNIGWIFSHYERPHLYSNIQSLVGLISGLTISIFLDSLSTPIIPGFQYWIPCVPTRDTCYLNIGWIYGHSDRTCILAFNHFSANTVHSPFQYYLLTDNNTPVSLPYPANRSHQHS
jgi:hypothetical protein